MTALNAKQIGITLGLRGNKLTLPAKPPALRCLHVNILPDEDSVIGSPCSIDLN